MTHLCNQWILKYFLEIFLQSNGKISGGETMGNFCIIFPHLSYWHPNAECITPPTSTCNTVEYRWCSLWRYRLLSYDVNIAAAVAQAVNDKDRSSCNYMSILCHFWDIASYLWEVASFHLLHLHRVPSLAMTHLNFTKMFDSSKLAIMWHC